MLFQLLLAYEEEIILGLGNVISISYSPNGRFLAEGGDALSVYDVSDPFNPNL